MQTTTTYPWLQQQWQLVMNRFQAGRLPHALLLSGPVGLGKQQFAVQVVRTLLCHDNRHTVVGQAVRPPCGQCQACHLLSAGTHPDFKLVVPEADGKQIPIDTIRELNRFFTLKSQLAPLQVVIIAPAEAMNNYAANSLLKTLEEPTPNSLIFLVTSQAGRLLPTIRSRCQLLDVNCPERTQAIAWLQAHSEAQGDTARLLTLADGAPLQALEYAKSGILKTYQQLLTSLQKIAKKQADPVIEAKLWETAGYPQSIKWLYFWISALIRFKCVGRQVDIDHNIGWQEPSLEILADGLNYQQLYHFLDKILASTRLVSSQANVQLALEDILINWYQLNAINSFNN